MDGIICLRLQKQQTIVLSLSTIILLAVPGGNGKKKERKRGTESKIKTVGQIKHEDGTEGCAHTHTEDTLLKNGT